jgi:fumarylacetoacetase
MNITHDPSIQSWVESANSDFTDFPLQNLPFGVFRRKGSSGKGTVGIALGDSIISLSGVERALPFEGTARVAVPAFAEDSLNAFMACGSACWSSVRRQVFDLFRNDRPGADELRGKLESALVPAADAELLLPARIGDYTDFYASIFHATNVGTMLRPDNPLFPNYKYVPIAYHGRSSSIVISGTPVRRPMGQTKDDSQPHPSFGPSRNLDYEQEMGIFIGPGNKQGAAIPIESAGEHLFGLCLLNDWSARDIQKWEYQPLGPFLAKNFATSISPWIVTMEALEPFRTPAFHRDDGDPQPLPYLLSGTDQKSGSFAITLEVLLATRSMRARGLAPHFVSRSNFSDLYWTVAQMLVHHTSNGCNLQPGDLLGTGTVSGREKNARGCLLELTWRGKEPLALPSGEVRTFLEDGDEVTLRGFAERAGARRIGFGTCTGIVGPVTGGLE